jgi:magnesium-transporting ATPase (P-type)
VGCTGHSFNGFNHSFIQIVCAAGRTKASTLSLSVLVAIEMFNAFNALSEDNSLLQLPPWSNPWLMVATCISLGLHCVILYIPFLAEVGETWQGRGGGCALVGV